jgi:hypothetical protein
VPERKLGKFFKSKSKIPDFERGKAEIIIVPRIVDTDIGKINSFRSGTTYMIEWTVEKSALNDLMTSAKEAHLKGGHLEY